MASARRSWARYRSATVDPASRRRATSRSGSPPSAARATPASGAPPEDRRLRFGGPAAGGDGAAGIDGVLPLEHGPDLAIGVDHERDAAGVARVVPGPVGLRHRTVGVGEERERRLQALRELLLG